MTGAAPGGPPAGSGPAGSGPAGSPGAGSPSAGDDDPDWAGWPTYDAQDTAAAKAVFEGKVAARGKRIEAAIARAQANRAADLAHNAAVQQALIEVARGGLDRARSNAETVQKAAGTIGTLYTGILAVAFSVTSRPLPVRGVLPALFLGLAVAASTAYLAYLSRRDEASTTSFRAGEAGLAGQLTRLEFLIRWVRGAVRERAWLLRSSVVALALGVVLLPVPFVDTGGRAAAAPTGPAWPAPPTGLDAELQKIRYQAEVSEVARLRAARAEDPDDVGFTVVVGLVGLALVALGGAVSKRPPGAARPEQPAS